MMTKKVMLRGGECKLEVEDALSYVLMVKETFYDDEDKYFDFIEIMKDLSKERISYEDVIAQVRSLLKEHPQLLIEFDYFLPPRDRMAGL
jgi:paired amphipathic helix protein Sin3a